MRFRCYRCGQPPKFHEFEGDYPGACPKCGLTGEPGVLELNDVHFIVLNPQGPITGAWGRQHVACEPRREYLALHSADHYAATDDPRAVTCRSCQGTPAWRQMAKLFRELAPVLAGMNAAGG